jgi:hypothetical protein
MIRQTDKPEIKKPVKEAILRGMILKEVIPSQANAIIFSSGYFV